MTVDSFSAQDTFALGQQIGEAAVPGEVYTLTGDLGVGKTVFTQGVAKGLGIKEAVNIPTFTILQVYEEGRLPFYHFDVYRIGCVEEMDEIGYEDYFYGDGVCFIEWADLIEEILPGDNSSYRFVVDRTAPTGTIKIVNKDGENVFDRLINQIKVFFGIYDNKQIKIEFTSEDITSIYTQKYYMYDPGDIHGEVEQLEIEDKSVNASEMTL